MVERLPKRVLFASPWWHTDLVNGVVRNATRRGWHIDLQTCLSGKLPEKWDGDGIVTQLGGDLNALQCLLKASNCPAVSLNNNLPEFKVPRVATDDTVIGRLAAGHFIERGFRRYAVYARHSSDHPRFRAFSQALAAVGFEARTLVWGRPDADTWLNRQAWLRETLNAMDKPTAVFAFNDELAVEVIEACLAESISIPEQIAVLGMLNMDLFHHCTTVGLSSIEIDTERITHLACELLGDMMDGVPPPQNATLIPPIGIVARQSTDTFAAQSPGVAGAVKFMQEHYARELSTGDIVEAMGGSRATLFNAFRKDLGKTPGEVLMRIRIDKAKHMLATTNDKVAAIAESCGFRTAVNLHRAFRQGAGMSPNAYRKSVRKRGDVDSEN